MSRESSSIEPAGALGFEGNAARPGRGLIYCQSCSIEADGFFFEEMYHDHLELSECRLPGKAKVLTLTCLSEDVTGSGRTNKHDGLLRSTASRNDNRTSLQHSGLQRGSLSSSTAAESTIRSPKQ